ncbi:hypothetical protein [Amycolatopsis vastitatis]|uniref:hypothetical protein n=1 Tax=Amycolatopsis vastitatis TaxID=1905142 RepID=UPI001F0AF0AD|nr:hypothetical protein [Amycolatopsis vastitatis]
MRGRDLPDRLDDRAVRRLVAVGEVPERAAQELVSASWAPTTAAVKKLVDACVAEGTIAAGHDPADIIMLMSFLWRVANNDDGAAQDRRLIATVFSGLQAPPRSS